MTPLSASIKLGSFEGDHGVRAAQLAHRTDYPPGAEPSSRLALQRRNRPSPSAARTASVHRIPSAMMLPATTLGAALNSCPNNSALRCIADHYRRAGALKSFNSANTEAEV